jgi:hypothetical protein
MKRSVFLYVPILAATAILLTIGRNGVLPIFQEYTLLDQAMNYFVVFIAPIFALMSIFSRPINRTVRTYSLVILLWFWIILCVLVSPSRYWPSQTAIITIFLSLLIPAQIERSDLKLVRYFILGICVVFNITVLLFHRDILNLILSGNLTERLGYTLSLANIVAYPRIVYTLVFTCFVTLLIDKGKWLRIIAAGLLILPLLVGLSSATRGPLVGLFAAVLAFFFAQRKWKTIVVTGLLTIILVILGFIAVQRLFPLLVTRFTTAGDSTRIANYWQPVFNSITIFGRGVGDDYAHNILLELLQDYGVTGLFLFLPVLIVAAWGIWKAYLKTLDLEVLWVIGLFVLQMVSQQFSLNIFFAGALWATMALVLGLSWVDKEPIVIPEVMQERTGLPKKVGTL